MVGFRCVPFGEEGELSLKAEKPVGRGGDGGRRLGQQGPSPVETTSMVAWQLGLHPEGVKAAQKGFQSQSHK